LCNIPHCCPPKESGPCRSPCLADHPLRPATRRRLGRPSPHQQADRPQAHPRVDRSFSKGRMPFPATSGITPPFGGLSPALGQVAYVLLNRLPLGKGPKSLPPLDLHTLGTPLAFVLSQDQTLHQIWIPTSCLIEKRSKRFETPYLPIETRVSIGRRSAKTRSRPVPKRFAVVPLFSFQGSPPTRHKNPHPLAVKSQMGYYSTRFP
jgi:hypothetical protein